MGKLNDNKISISKLLDTKQELGSTIKGLYSIYTTSDNHKTEKNTLQLQFEDQAILTSINYLTNTIDKIDKILDSTYVNNPLI